MRHSLERKIEIYKINVRQVPTRAVHIRLLYNSLILTLLITTCHSLYVENLPCVAVHNPLQQITLRDSLVYIAATFSNSTKVLR